VSLIVNNGIPVLIQYPLPFDICIHKCSPWASPYELRGPAVGCSWPALGYVTDFKIVYSNDILIFQYNLGLTFLLFL
jgi:hypothetical protein